jgi:hypothetical protein
MKNYMTLEFCVQNYTSYTVWHFVRTPVLHAAGAPISNPAYRFVRVSVCDPVWRSVWDADTSQLAKKINQLL